MPNPEYEERARATKVDKLVRTCDVMDWNADDVEAMNADNWLWLAVVADTNPPSDRTKAVVLHVLREREQ